MPTKPFALAVFALALALATPVAARSGQVALTYDDLPGVTLPSKPWVEAFNRDLLAALRRHRIKVTGFVNEGKLVQLDPADKTSILQGWLREGMDLGNHTYSHESLNVLGADQFIADIKRGEPVTRALLAKRGRHLHWFRYPNLETGPDAQSKAKVATWLTSHGYRSAPVTIDADDWEFATPYEDALRRRDSARAKAIREEYLAHTAAIIDWSRKAARALFGRDIAYVMLLHDSRLGADTVDALADLLKARNLRTVSLDRAMRDRAYATPDTYAGSDGIEWLERWSKTLGKALPWDDYPDVPADVSSSYDRLESDRHGGQDKLTEELATRGANHFASGWVWLAADNGQLSVVETHDAETLADQGPTPLLVIDLWEHAYYLDRKNVRPDYLKAVLTDLLNWDFAAENLARPTRWTYPA